MTKNIQIMPTWDPLDKSILIFNPDAYEQPAIALKLEIEQNQVEQPRHKHRKGQLIFALRGGITCYVENAMWIVPPQHAVWIPSGMFHSNRASENTLIYLLFIEPEVIWMPEKCCTLSISPHVRELICFLATQHQEYPKDSPLERLVKVLLEQLNTSPVEELQLPISEHPKIKALTDALTLDPGDRSTVAEWAKKLAMSERSLARLMDEETGLSFGRWRQQLHLIIALRQLASGEAVQNVAGSLGYESVTSFILMFKKAMGKAPGKYFAKLR